MSPSTPVGEHDPGGFRPETNPVDQVRLIVEKDLRIPMVDGVALRADVYRPDVGGPLPTLVQRTPYNKEGFFPRNAAIDVLRAAQRGFAVVVQDVRGRYASEGSFTPFTHEAKDGVDTLDWVVRQPWASGRVGGIGASYFGATQWLTAALSPPSLSAMAPVITSDGFEDGWVYRGGALQLGFLLHWTLLYLALGEAQRRVLSGELSDVGPVVDLIDRNEELYRRPVGDLPELGDLAPYLHEWLAPDRRGNYWRAIPQPRHSYEAIVAPALNVGGWYDIFLPGTLANFNGMRSRGGSAPARRSRLIVGPWAHGALGGVFAGRSFGMRADANVFDLTGEQLRWFSHHLADEDNGVDRDAPVQIFVMGENRWRYCDDWPLPGTEYKPLYLHSNGNANGRAGDGTLSFDPSGDESPDVYRYDPRDPVPTVGGRTFLTGVRVTANAGPRDQRWIEDRRDVLCYETTVLDEPLEVIGPIEVVLFVSSSAADTDFTAKLVDVWPDGRAENLAEGIIRARYRHSMSEPEPLVPDRVEEVRIDLAATANVFAAGHRLRLEVSSSNFPQFDRNPNTGAGSWRTAEEDLVVAVNRVHHTRRSPSRLMLPILQSD